MATYIKTEDSGYVSYENQPEEAKELLKNELTGDEALEKSISLINGAKIKSAINVYENVEIPATSLYANLALPETVPQNGFICAALEDWNRPASGVAPLVLHSRKTGVTVMSVSAVTFPRIVIRFYYVEYDVKGDS